MGFLVKLHLEYNSAQLHQLIIVPGILLFVRNEDNVKINLIKMKFMHIM